MKHAGPDALEKLQRIVSRLRRTEGLVERTPGSFYWRSSAFVHFHEDPGGLFADLKETASGFTRYRVSTRAEQERLLDRVASCLEARGKPPVRG